MIVVNRGEDNLSLYETKEVRVIKHEDDEEFFRVSFHVGEWSSEEVTHYIALEPSGPEIIEVLANDGKHLVTVTEKLAKWRLR